jgi:hypothetical protein
MTQELKYPYQHINTFIVSVAFKRLTKVPPKIELPTTVSVQLTEPGFPRVQVAMRLNSPEDTSDEPPISFSLEVVGLFDYTGSSNEYDKQLNREFAEERALHVLWVYCSQMVKMFSSQMGMNPLELRSPMRFNFSEATPAESKKKSPSRKQKTTKKTSR